MTVDNAEAGASYFGCAASEAASGNRLYAADFGRNGIDVFDANWNPIAVAGGFANPCLPADYYPWNIQYIDGSLFVAYAKYSGLPGEELHGKGFGRIAEFDLDGNLIKNWEDLGLLNAPWGFAVAPADFGDMSGKWLVSDFGDGRVTAFDRSSKKATGYLLGHNGKPVSVGGICGIWGIVFGNGASLGEHNHLCARSWSR
ncbi:uncharacterized protein (TIGR03118 family) [Tahibacter aquaticus]|uniref:Uncharacterized protein (TIGR03118 family) n=1 Tax=Tahibacter aquaticus TaxID=520092 RepID=A0A4R6Z026_9GAMM|nr:uncharacterized protein (TIGR03118 family) [Tahibacter aquaticus]